MAEIEDAGNAKSQLDKFKEAARALECDDDEGRFDERVKRLVAHRPLEKPETPEAGD